MNIHKKIIEITNQLTNLTSDSTVKYGNKSFNYLSLEGIYTKLMPLLWEIKVSMSFNIIDNEMILMLINPVENEDNKIINEEKTIKMPLIIDTKLQTDKLKALGSAITYTKRYLIGNMFNLNVAKDHEIATEANNQLKYVNTKGKFINSKPPLQNVCKQCNGELDLNSRFTTDEGHQLAPCKTCKKPDGKKVWVKMN